MFRNNILKLEKDIGKIKGVSVPNLSLCDTKATMQVKN